MKIGFIGIGNMGGALLRGSIAAGTAAEDVYAYDKSEQTLRAAVKELEIHTCESIEELVKSVDTVLIAVKPNIYESVLPEIAAALNQEQVVVSIAAGMSIGFIEQYLGKETAIVRIMPNTPAMVGESMTAVCKNDQVSELKFAPILKIFQSIGKAEVVEEEMIHAVIGVSGSSPAYAYMFIEALMEGAVKNGMNREQAKVFAAQSVLGAAKMVLETDVDPVQLRINVCSPGGTTIEAVNSLEDSNFQEIVIRAMDAAIEKSKAMTK